MPALEAVGQPFKFGRNRRPFQTVVAQCPRCQQAHLWRIGPDSPRASYACPACRATSPRASVTTPAAHNRASCPVCQRADQHQED